MKYKVCGFDKNGSSYYLQSDLHNFDPHDGMVWESEAKAKNVISTLKKSKKTPQGMQNIYRTMKVIAVLDNKVRAIAPDCKPGDVTNWIDGATKLMADLPKLKAELEMALKHTEEETQDLLHAIEMTRFNACQGFEFAKRMQVVRNKRRKIKDDLRSLEMFMSEFDTKKFQNTRGLIDGLSNRKYGQKTDVLRGIATPSNFTNGGNNAKGQTINV